MVGVSIRSNLAEVHQIIERALVRSGRASGAVSLIAVSKTKPIEVIEEALLAGQRAFGENYVQEFVEKAALAPTAEWHFIGSLQSNKADGVVGSCRLIHSLDRPSLAVKLDALARKKNVVQDVLVQVHIGQESTKHGALSNDLDALVGQVRELKSLRLCGLMAIPPLTEVESTARGYFSELRQNFERIGQQLSQEERVIFQHLSMGTSSDFEWAVLEGATLVRVGTAIFGRREAKLPV